MGKYLDDPILNEALENYFNESFKISKPFQGEDKMKDVYNIINKNKNIFEKEVNKICKEVFDNIKSQIESNKLDNAVKHYEDDFKSMIKSNKPPVLDYIDSFNSEIYSMIFKYYPSSIYEECMMAFEYKVLQILKKSQIMNKFGFKFGTEDTKGIWIILK